MSWDHDDDGLEHDLHIYSELEVNPEVANGFTIPKTIQMYQQKIQYNNSSSIFDTNYYLESLPKNGEDANGDVDMHRDFLDDENTIKVSIGRGRGGRNTFYRPGDLPGTNNGEELMQEIRKINPLGYSNAITEQAVKAHQKKRSARTTPTEQKIIIEDKPGRASPALTGGTASSMSPASDTTDEASTKGDTTTTTAASSEYFTGRELLEADEATTAEAEGANAAKKKPMSITQMLQKNREYGRRLQLRRQQQALERYNSQQQEASRRVIEEILRRDLEEAQMKPGISSSSSTTSLSSRDGGTPLSWRQRTNSPPRYQWKQQTKRRDNVNINSTTDFPPLK